MKLLFDENISRALCRRLGGLFAGSVHVAEIGLERAGDGDIWELAKADGFVIVTKDSDFQQRSFLFGAPPSVVWLRVGNASTAEIEAALRANVDAIEGLASSASVGILILDV